MPRTLYNVRFLFTGVTFYIDYDLCFRIETLGLMAVEPIFDVSDNIGPAECKVYSFIVPDSLQLVADPTEKPVRIFLNHALTKKIRQ